ncbi:uncharacterized protein LOC116995471 isoform X2 [Catharus ustulatus]|nr:uncharacterized protein LOC116995471 isoform X2 [Catharus ustulatus]
MSGTVDRDQQDRDKQDRRQRQQDEEAAGTQRGRWRPRALSGRAARLEVAFSGVGPDWDEPWCPRGAGDTQCSPTQVRLQLLRRELGVPGGHGRGSAGAERAPPSPPPSREEEEEEEEEEGGEEGSSEMARRRPALPVPERAWRGAVALRGVFGLSRREAAAGGSPSLGGCPKKQLRNGAETRGHPAGMAPGCPRSGHHCHLPARARVALAERGWLRGGGTG